MFANLIYTGVVRHRRFTPKKHQFSYKLFMFYFDINAINSTFKAIKQVSIERFNWFSYYRKHYLSHPQITLDNYARQLIFAKFDSYPSGKIYLLTQLACLGYCFNPISLYFVFAKNNQQLEYLIIEVTNTPWGEKHNYIVKYSSRPKNNVYNFQFQKELHVSPFMAMNYTYHFNLKLNAQKIIVHMENHKNGKKDFDATLILKAANQKASACQKIFRRYPLITYKIALAIYSQALKLWIKGLPFYTHPHKDKGI